MALFRFYMIVFFSSTLLTTCVLVPYWLALIDVAYDYNQSLFCSFQVKQSALIWQRIGNDCHLVRSHFCRRVMLRQRLIEVKTAQNIDCRKNILAQIISTVFVFVSANHKQPSPSDDTHLGCYTLLRSGLSPSSS